MRVLAVDDSAVTRSAVRRELAATRCELLEATSGEEALALVAREWPELVILDVGLPGMDGLETCRRIRALEAMERTAPAGAVPIVFLTADDTEVGRAEGFEAGAVDFIGKPFAPGRLREVVETLLRPDAPPQAPAALVVDDSPLVRRIVCDALTQVGIRSECAADGLDALQRLQANPAAYDLVITDYIMARLNGDAFCLALRADDRLRRLPVLVMSALDDAGHFRHLIASGASDFVRKPFVKEVFLNRVAGLLRRHRAWPQVTLRLARLFGETGFQRALARFGVPRHGREVQAMLKAAGALEARGRTGGA